MVAMYLSLLTDPNRQTERKMKQKLTIEESAKLIKLGAEAKLASRHTLGVQIPTGIPNIYRKEEDSKPIFTLTDLLSILPKEIEIEGEKEDLNIVMDNWGALVGYPKFHEKHGCAFVSPELIDALYQLLIWCINKHHINLKLNVTDE